MDIIRVGTLNNFDMTETEFEHLKFFYSENRKFFVNSNSFTILHSDLPSFVTINPYLKFEELKGDISNVKAVRIKVIMTSDIGVLRETARCVAYCIKHNLNILFTFMRFRSNESMNKFYGRKEDYVWDHNWFRPTEEARTRFRKFVEDNIDYAKIYWCDFEGKGCPVCGNCIKLSQNINDTKDYEVKSLDLSCSGCSGKCKYNCPDCFAKVTLWRTGGMPKCDFIKENRKQSGKFTHK